MRPSYREIKKETRYLLYDKVLSILPKGDSNKSEQRQSVRNLLNDLATDQNTIDEIIQYLLENGYPSNDSGKNRIWSKEEWLRKGGEISYIRPHYIMSIQRLDVVIESILESYSSLEDLDTYGIRRGMTADTFLKSLFSLLEEREANIKRGGEMSKVKLRFDDNANMWFTWNEEDFESPPELIKWKEDKIKLLRALGLGVNLRASDEDYICLCLHMNGQTDFIPYRAGWGDATTYSFWRPIQEENALYGYTFAIDLPSNYNQPEAVATNSCFHLDTLTNHSFIPGT